MTFFVKPVAVKRIKKKREPATAQCFKVASRRNDDDIARLCKISDKIINDVVFPHSPLLRECHFDDTTVTFYELFKKK